jgi:hypothetical protein
MWLQKVFKNCNELGEKLDNDYYPFQSSRKSLIEGVDLLIVGANPRGKSHFCTEKKIDKLFNCGEDDINAFIYYENCKEWKINQPVLKIFSTDNLRGMLKNAVIMNAVYFDTNDIQSLKKDAIPLCVQLTKEFIEILKPKIILFLGFDAPKWLNVKFNKEENGILFLDEVTKKCALIFEVKSKNTIYIIHHPSRNPLPNNSDNLERKRNKFEDIFSSIK